MTNQRPVAVFDIDGTIFRSSLFIEMVEMLIDEGYFPKKARDQYRQEFEKWVAREGDYEAYIGAMIAVFERHIKGIPVDEFSRIGKAVVGKHKNRVYRYTRDLVPKLKANGYFLLAVSQSPRAALVDFCSHLGFDKVYGRFYEEGPDGLLTGVTTDLHLIANKANIVKRALEKENLTLTGSVGVGDTEGDISFLEMVENPVCFNPNKKLYEHAKRMGWKVVVERKDVIYEIPPGK